MLRVGRVTIPVSCLRFSRRTYEQTQILLTNNLEMNQVLTIVLHLFGILLIYQTQRTTLEANGFAVHEVREILRTGLETLALISRTGVMSREARKCMTNSSPSSML